MAQTVDETGIAEIQGLDYEGRGVARVAGKTVFIEGALPQEQVRWRISRRKKQFDEGRLVAVVRASAQRVVPKCGYFETCGGCTLQHAQPEAQVAYKQRVLEEQLQRIGKVKPERLLTPIYGSAWAYRQRGRFSVAYPSEGRVRLGFQARRSHDVVAIETCAVVPTHVSQALPLLRDCLQQWADDGVRVDGVAFAVGEAVNVFTLHFKKRPSEAVLRRLHEIHGRLPQTDAPWQFWLQYGRLPAQPYYPEQAPPLFYSLPEFDVRMPYRPGDFTQINAEMNRLMVSRAVRLLAPAAGERIADLFCGLGNFSLPLAKSGAQVLGIEGAEFLTERALENARLNGCEGHTFFQTADLFEADAAMVASWGYCDKMLLDPPRSGAYALVQALQAPYLPQRIVYVSCNPASFARDAAVLVGKGYRFMAAGVMNMFAQTAHVESVGWFEYGGVAER